MQPLDVLYTAFHKVIGHWKFYILFCAACLWLIGQLVHVLTAKNTEAEIKKKCLGRKLTKLSEKGKKLLPYW